MTVLISDVAGATDSLAPSGSGPARAFLDVRNLSKSFGPIAALKDVSLEIGAAEIRAVCGENGAGKSTLVKILTGVYRPDAGTVTVAGKVQTIASPRQAQELGIALVAQELSLCPDLSVEDNIWLGSVQVPFFHKRPEMRRRAAEALRLLKAEHIGLDTPVGRLGMGARQLVEIARMLTRDARLLILDEPTATLSDIEIERIFEALLALRREGRSVLYITHRLAEVFRICDSVTVLRNGELVATSPAASLDRNTLIELMLGRSFVEMYPEASATEQGTAAMRVSALTVPDHVERFDMEVPRGRIVAIAGQVGSGADAVVNAIVGLVPDATGSIEVGGRALALGSTARALRHNVLFVSGDRAEQGIFRRLKVGENLVATRLRRYARLGILNRAGLRATARRLAAAVGVDRRRLRARADELSGGNQQKLAFGRCIDRGASGVLVLHEPTRGIDVGARAEIYRIMRQFCDAGYGIVMTSSDLEEIVGMSDVVLTLYRGRQVATYLRPDISLEQVVSDITNPMAGAA